MAILSYTMFTSLDGYTAGPDGAFDWADPPLEVHRHAEAAARAITGEIYGPRMWETMRVWQDIHPGDGVDYGEGAQAMYDFAEVWRAIPKHVFNRAQGKPLTGEALRELKAASDGVLSISGPGLAAVALREGEVDEVARYVVPVCIGGGTPWWPEGVEAPLELVEHEALADGWIFLRYAVKR